VGRESKFRLAWSDEAVIFRFVWPSRDRPPGTGGANWHPRSTVTMPHQFRVDRVRGCLLGMAVGDALGAPLEGLSGQQIRTHYGRVRNYVDGGQAWKRKPYRWRMHGLYSDDTQQALALCDILLDYQRVDPERLADLLSGAVGAQHAFFWGPPGHARG